jgi:hypothetical protein
MGDVLAEGKIILSLVEYQCPLSKDKESRVGKENVCREVVLKFLFK